MGILHFLGCYPTTNRWNYGVIVRLMRLHAVSGGVFVEDGAYGAQMQIVGVGYSRKRSKQMVLSNIPKFS